MKIIFVTVAANITDSEHYDDTGDDNQKSACRVCVVSIVVCKIEQAKITVFCRMEMTGGHPTNCIYFFIYYVF
jgi:hypothetical protein